MAQTTAISVVSQLVNEGRLQFGDLDRVDVPHQLWEQVMDEVAAAGGQVGFDTCVVDGVAVGAGQLPSGEAAAYHPAGQSEVRYLPPAEQR
ncbi:MAG: hypothetical protein GEU81_14850 [Nitriliruptorales bacterium]|nr:hypothetical protein [Nitriliruptorales bacterium]